MTPRRSPVLETLAELYAASTAGCTGSAERDFSVRYDELLRRAGCLSGERFANAEADLAASDGTALALLRHPRSRDAQRVKVPLACEAALFARIGRASPTVERDAWAALFTEAESWSVPLRWRAAWDAFCRERAESARHGTGWLPFRKSQRQRARLQLEVVARLLAWEPPTLLRTVSARLTPSSKFLGRCRTTIETLLTQASGGQMRAFADLGIADNPRTVIFHGPVRVRGIEYTPVLGESSLSEDDLAQAAAIECAAPRCVTVENATKFHELCRLRCGDLFVLTSYPNRATVEFLRRLPPSLPRYHFGDTDPWGFNVLRTIRRAVAPIPVAPLHMNFRAIQEAPALTARDIRKLVSLLADPDLGDVRPELAAMRASGTKGDFEQETLLVAGEFPYHSYTIR